MTDPFDGVEHDEVEGVPAQVPVNDGERVAGGQTHQERPPRQLGGIVLNFMETAPTDRKGRLQRVSTWVVVVAVVVRELFSLEASAICVQIRGDRSEVTKLFTTMAQVFCLLLCSYHSGFVETVTTLFCCVNIKLILFFVD